jgi:Fe-S-cluster-containing dehydrogenase component
MSTTQLGFSFDVSRCSGCMACIVACLDQNDLPDNGSRFRHVK